MSGLHSDTTAQVRMCDSGSQVRKGSPSPWFSGKPGTNVSSSRTQHQTRAARAKFLTREGLSDLNADTYASGYLQQQQKDLGKTDAGLLTKSADTMAWRGGCGGG